MGYETPRHVGQDHVCEALTRSATFGCSSCLPIGFLHLCGKQLQLLFSLFQNAREELLGS